MAPEKPLPKRAVRSRWIVQTLIFFLGVAFLANALVGDHGVLATLNARREYERLSADLAQQRALNARLREEARRLREDPAAIEEIARGDLGLIRPGEKVFIVRDLPSAGAR